MQKDIFERMMLGEFVCVSNRGIKHDFPFINICKVLREVLKTEGVANVNE